MKTGYTAQEMRIRAAYLERALADAKTAAMLRQAADVMEREEKRERKYEFAEKFKEGMVSYLHIDRPIDHGEICQGSIVVRREVGEWEEVL